MNIAAVVVTTVGVDVFRQMQQVSLATRVVSISSEMRSRLNSVYILAVRFLLRRDHLLLYSTVRHQIFIGQVVGSYVCTAVYIKYGWRALGALMFALGAFQIPILFMRGPHTQRRTWFGYEGGFRFSKHTAPTLEGGEGDLELVEKGRANGRGEGSPQGRDDKRDQSAGAAQ